MNILQPVVKRLKFLTYCVKCENFLNRYPNINILVSARWRSTNVLDKNIAYDVKLFVYENPRKFRLMNLCVIAQFVFWNYIGMTAYSCLRDIPVDETVTSGKPWWQRINLGKPLYRNGLTFFCLAVGFLALAGGWIYTLKSVRMLVLRKGGKSVTFVTYTPFGTNRLTTIPLDKMTCQLNRIRAKGWLPIHVKGYSLPYILDMNGEFLNGPLFDRTAGIQRQLK